MNSLNHTSSNSLTPAAAGIKRMREEIQAKRDERAGLVHKIINDTSWNQNDHWENLEASNDGEKQAINSPYSREWNAILYWENVEVLYADAESFRTPFNDKKYAIDCHNVYISWMHIPGADPKSFSFYLIEWLESVYATDNTGRVYYKWETIPVDKESFQIVSIKYTTDNTGRVYYKWEPIPVDKETFQVFSTRYAFDKYWVYKNGVKLTGEELKKAIEKYNIPVNMTMMFLKNLLK